MKVKLLVNNDSLTERCGKLIEEVIELHQAVKYEQWENATSELYDVVQVLAGIYDNIPWLTPELEVGWEHYSKLKNRNWDFQDKIYEFSESNKGEKENAE